jgi:hypothetical protein
LGDESEVIFTLLPKGKYTVKLDVEPLLGGLGMPFNLIIKLGAEEKKYPLSGRGAVVFEFESSGEPLQIVKLKIEGGMDKPPKNDSRLLKMRVFNVSSPYPTENDE